jgi:hypothetical protein
MRKWNAILSISIVAVLLIPVMMAGSIASACCGVQPTGLTVGDSPDPACINNTVAIKGEYTVIQIYSVIDPYDTGVDLKVWNPGGVLIVNKTLTLATGQTTAPKTFPFGDAVVVNMLGTYKYEVVAWSRTIWGREESNIVVGTILVNCFPVPVDIRPTSCPNPLNLGEKGVLPVAILGTKTFDVTKIVPESVRLLLSVAPLRSALEDVATPQPPAPSPPTPPEACSYCNTLGPDGYMDLTLKFDAEAVVNALIALPTPDPADGDCVRLFLRGALVDGKTFIIGGDFVVIIDKAK